MPFAIPSVTVFSVLLASIYGPLGKCNWQSKPGQQARKPLILAVLVKLDYAAAALLKVLSTLAIIESPSQEATSTAFF